jgi:hypothetical protein
LEREGTRGRRRPVVSSPPPTGDRAWLAIGPR